MFNLTNHPNLTYRINGQFNEVILSVENFRAFMRSFTRDTDWSNIRDYLHDTFDRVLINEDQSKKATPCVFEGTQAVERALCL